MREADYDNYDLSSLKVKIGGSAPCTVALKQEIADRMPGEMLEIYSLTEGGVTCVLLVNHMPDKLASVGVPTQGCVIHIVDDEGNILPQGERGEIVGRSNLKMSGYLNRKEETEAAIWRDPEGNEYICSGDIGCLDEDGYLYLLDRKKDMIISGGMNIYAADIEAVLVEHEAIHEIAVVGMPSDAWGETPQAFVVLEPGASINLAALVEFGADKLSKAQRISGLWILDTMPLNGLGKILKTDIRKSGRNMAISGEGADA